MSSPIYLDYAASTPTDPVVADAMHEHLCLGGNFANPASRGHVYGWQADEAVESARTSIAQMLNADPREIVWTSGATESDNLAIKGLMSRGLRTGRKHIVTSAIEHKAILDTCAWMENQGFCVTYIKPSASGEVMLADVEAALRDDTLLVTVMQVNNELGSVSDIAGIARICRERGVISHTDAAQSFGKIPVDVKELGVDLLSLSAHKIYGPKGIGALYVRRQDGLVVDAQVHGGGHEMGMRSGTLPTHQIVGLASAAQLMQQEMADQTRRIGDLRDRFIDHLRQIPNAHLNSDPAVCIPQIINVAFEGVDGETLLLALNEVAISTGSACNSAKVEPSHVLTGIGLSQPLADASLRFSFGRYTQANDIDQAATHLSAVLGRLRQ
ncbi:MAG: aminotransferase class V-fold PLP-dependent enzyme [Pseudomonadota bacterium]|nr:aminotransferase class V-fold PLP-dependent enzyme [Pseudomonadota bacterium]